MTTGTTGRGTAQASHEHINALRAAQALKDRRRKLRIRIASISATIAVIGIVAAMMLTSRQETSATTRVAPDFTLTNTSGAAVSLSGAAREESSCCTSARAPAARPAWSRWPRSRKTRPSPRQD